MCVCVGVCGGPVLIRKEGPSHSAAEPWCAAEQVLEISRLLCRTEFPDAGVLLHWPWDFSNNVK